MAVLIIVAWLRFPAKSRASGSEEATAAEPARPSTGNAGNDILLPKSAQDRKTLLGTDAGCPADVIYYDGFYPTNHKAYWSVRCAATSGGFPKAYMIQIEPDTEGSTRVTECEVMEAIHIPCLAPLEGRAR